MATFANLSTPIIWGTDVASTPIDDDYGLPRPKRLPGLKVKSLVATGLSAWLLAAPIVAAKTDAELPAQPKFPTLQVTLPSSGSTSADNWALAVTLQKAPSGMIDQDILNYDHRPGHYAEVSLTAKFS